MERLPVFDVRQPERDGRPDHNDLAAPWPGKPHEHDHGFTRRHDRPMFFGGISPL